MDVSRQQRMIGLAQERGLDVVALMPGPNLFYVTGLSFFLSERPVVGFFPVDQPPALVLPALEADKVTDMETFPYTDEDGYALAFQQACAKLEIAEARVGVEALRMRLLESRILQRYAAGSELVPADDLFADLRICKEERELEAMRRAISVAERAFEAWLGQLHVGMTEKEAAARLTAAMLTGGADALSFDPIVAGGPHGGVPHAVPGDRPFAAGDWVVVDWGAFVDGYASDLTRMVVFGEPTGPLQAIHSLVLQANAAGRAAVHPGISAFQVDQVTRAVIAEAGYGSKFTHRTGHGLGLEIHEPPFIVAGNATTLVPGMTFTVEPGIYLEGVGGVRIEDDVLVTEHGMETLTTLPREPFLV